MEIKKEHIKHVKGYLITIVFAVLVMILVLSVINVSTTNIAGKAFYRPTQIYGRVLPALPDGTNITFSVGQLEIASTLVKEGEYGFDEKVIFKRDDDATAEKEGYAPGDIVTVYIEGIEVQEFSYFGSLVNKKDIKITASKRIEITSVAQDAVRRRNCVPIWNCDTWTACESGLQTRQCIDVMNCILQDGRPEESRTCALTPLLIPLGTEEKKIPYGSLFIVIFLLVVIGFMINLIISLKRMRTNAEKVRTMKQRMEKEERGKSAKKK